LVESWIGCGKDDFAWAAFAGDQDADAFEHFCRGAGAFGQKDVGASGAVVGGYGSGDKQGREGRVELFGAADQLVAVHLRHEEVAEEEVDGAGNGVGDGLDGVVGIIEGDYAIAAGFEKKGSDGENLLVVINAKNDFFRAHVYSVLPGSTMARLQNRVDDVPGGLGPGRRVCWLAGALVGCYVFTRGPCR
jgi:hypothetical protein